MGESVTEGTISRWLKAVGDSVTEGESLVEVTTDKVDVEVPSPAAGTLEAIVAQEGDTVTVGATLATIAAGCQRRRRAVPATRRQRGALGRATARRPSHRRSAAPRREPRRRRSRSPPPPSRRPPPRRRRRPGRRLAAGPPPRRARGRGPHRRRTGTGPGGLVRAADVTAAAHGTPAAPARSAAPAAPAGEGTVELRGPAASLVDYMEQSRDIPTATSFRTVPVTVLDARRRELNLGLTTAGKQIKVSFTHLIGYAIARAAAEMPEMSAHFARTEQGSRRASTAACTSAWPSTAGARTAAASSWCR